MALGLLGLGRGAPPLWTGGIVLGLGLGLVQIVALTQFARIGIRFGQGKISGLTSLAGPFGSFLGSLLGGVIGRALGLQTIFLLFVPLFVLVLGLLLCGRGESLARNAVSQGSTAPVAAAVDRNSRLIRSGGSSRRRLIPVLGLHLTMGVALALISILASWPLPLPDSGTVGERTTELLVKARSWFEPKPTSASVAPPTGLAARP